MRETAYYDEVDLHGLIETLLRRKWWIVGITVAALAVAAILSFMLFPPTYAVQVQVMLPANADFVAELTSNGPVHAAAQPNGEATSFGNGASNTAVQPGFRWGSWW